VGVLISVCYRFMCVDGCECECACMCVHCLCKCDNKVCVVFNSVYVDVCVSMGLCLFCVKHVCACECI